MNVGEGARDRLSELALPAALICGVAGIAFAAWFTQSASALEATAFVTGAICVWLVVRQNIWNFPLGLLNVAVFAWIFYEYRLYADAGLQVFYFILNLVGWYLWMFGGEDRSALKVSRISRREIVLTAAGIAVSTLALRWALTKAQGAAPLWDALTTSISLAAQWLQSRKKVECWHLWILADVIYVPLYVSRGLNLTALLYLLFLGLAAMGLIAWRKAVKP